MAMHLQTATHWYCLSTFLETLKSVKKCMVKILFVYFFFHLEEDIKDPIDMQLNFFSERWYIGVFG